MDPWFLLSKGGTSFVENTFTHLGPTMLPLFAEIIIQNISEYINAIIDRSNNNVITLNAFI